MSSAASKQILLFLLSNANKKWEEIELGCVKAALGPSEAVSLVSQNHRFWLTSLPRPVKFLIFKECTTLFMFFLCFLSNVLSKIITFATKMRMYQAKHKKTWKNIKKKKTWKANSKNHEHRTQHKKTWKLWRLREVQKTYI